MLIRSLLSRFTPAIISFSSILSPAVYVNLIHKHIIHIHHFTAIIELVNMTSHCQSHLPSSSDGALAPESPRSR